MSVGTSCLVNDPAITRDVLNNAYFCRCISYRLFIVLMLLFCYISDIFAFIYIHETLIALIWDIGYLILTIIGTFGLQSNNFILIYIYSFIFLVDTIVAVVTIILLSTTTFKFEYLDYNISIILFSLFAFIQSIFFILMIKITSTIRNGLEKV